MQSGLLAEFSLFRQDHGERQPFVSVILLVVNYPTNTLDHLPFQQNPQLLELPRGLVGYEIDWILETQNISMKELGFRCVY